jgi:PAS domain S-box-containing protein
MRKGKFSGHEKSLQKAAFIVFESDDEGHIPRVADFLQVDHVVYPFSSLGDQISASPPDLLLFGPQRGKGKKEAFDLCHRLRRSGYQGVILLLIGEGEDFISIAAITAAGFDNYLPLEGSAEFWEEAVSWGIINRRRKNKYVVQFDDNPDSFCILDREGHIHEINRTAAAGSGYSPREIVTERIHASRIPSLEQCEKRATSLIAPENIDKVFVRTLSDGKTIYQLKTKVHNLPTIGLVAALIKSDITQTIYSRTLDVLVNSVLMLSERDQYTAGHSARVLHYCMHLVDLLGHSGNRRFKSQLYHAALLHDIGKVGIRDNILLKPGKLNAEEFDSLATHPVKGYRILQHFEFLRDSLDLIRSHHERPDGRGYPDKLKGNDIPLGASIISVADSFDAMTSNRPYRKSLGYEKALSEIRDNSGSQYDSEVASAFLGHFSPDLHERIKADSRKPLETIAKEMIQQV